MVGADDGSETLAGEDSIHDRSSAPSIACLIPIDVDPRAPITLDDDHLEVGRDFDGLIAPDRRLSKKHFDLRRDSSGWILRDLGSRNGTFVDGRPLPPNLDCPLEDEAVLRAGDSLFLFGFRAPCTEVDEDPLLPGRSPSIMETRGHLRRIAGLPGPVLILGETGTGKDFAARMLCRLARPEPSPYVVVNCGELDPALARAELFGAEKGAFTDARELRTGLITSAQDGTMFLDEIGNLKPSVQEELLRFLEDGTYRRVGGTTLLNSSARIVAATNADLDDAVATGVFRQDLLARLRAVVAPIVMPPLRERREDIARWARLLMELDEPRTGLAPKPMAPGCIESLLLCPWPDNLRGLRRAMNTALLASGDAERLAASDLPVEVRAARAQAREEDPLVHAELPPLRTDYEPTCEEIRTALTESKGNVVRVAARFGIHRRKLYRICRKMEIDPKSFRNK